MTRATHKELEARWYWTVTSQINFLRRAQMAYPYDVADSVSELEVLVEHTEWPTLRRLCLASVAVLTPTAALADRLDVFV